MGDYLVLILCLSHLILVGTVLTVWAIAVSYLDAKISDAALVTRYSMSVHDDSCSEACSP
jgi:hypothetical protein